MKKAPKRSSPPSGHDVAALAGVSQAAVSRAFTPGAVIAEATRARVMVAAEKLDYRPNFLARSLITGRSGIVGVVMGNPKNPFFVTALEALSSGLSKSGRQILIFTSEDQACVADVQVEDLLKFRVDALLLMSANLSPSLVGRCRSTALPVIFFNRMSRKPDGMWGVTGDNRRGGRKIAEHLLERGYRRPAYIAGFTNSTTNRDRQSAFSDYVVSRGLPAPQCVEGHFQRAGAMAAARQLLGQRQRPDAIFCSSDYMALATIEVARYEFGLAMGKDLGVVGFDGIEQAEWPSYDLTTYEQPVQAMVDRVIKILDDPKGQASERIVLPGVLKIRGSTQRG
jgi:DNA-binding LacI/PurR family transcriptional regulator